VDLHYLLTRLGVLRQLQQQRRWRAALTIESAEIGRRARRQARSRRAAA